MKFSTPTDTLDPPLATCNRKKNSSVIRFADNPKQTWRHLCFSTVNVTSFSCNLWGKICRNGCRFSKEKYEIKPQCHKTTGFQVNAILNCLLVTVVQKLYTNWSEMNNILFLSLIWLGLRKCSWNLFLAFSFLFMCLCHLHEGKLSWLLKLQYLLHA